MLEAFLGSGSSINTTTTQVPTAYGGSTGNFSFGGAQPTMQGSDDLINGTQTISASSSNILVIAFAVVAVAVLVRRK